ncbi:hypothetical protein Tco_1083188 [Tanacetum coccineum]|uniref:Uncharacterized protein n=1 Tax=Tanacetum coccineum TaxID=301880 RepID=A0ABQ5I4M7_9ASTR
MPAIVRVADILRKYFSGPRPLSRNCKAKNSPYGSSLQPHGEDNVDIWWARNKYPSVIVNESFIYVTHSLFPIRILQGVERRLGDRGGGGCCEVGGGGGGWVIGGVAVVCGDGVDSGVRGVVCGVVYRFVCGVVCGVVGGQGTDISTMIVSVPENDRGCGTRGKVTLQKLHRRGDQDLDTKGMVIGYVGLRLRRQREKGIESPVLSQQRRKRFEGYRCEMKCEKLLQYPYTIADHEKPANSMRADGGYEVIKMAIGKLKKKHIEHIAAYGEGSERRSTGKHETADIKNFKGVIH